MNDLNTGPCSREVDGGCKKAEGRREIKGENPYCIIHCAITIPILHPSMDQHLC